MAFNINSGIYSFHNDENNFNTPNSNRKPLDPLDSKIQSRVAHPRFTENNPNTINASSITTQRFSLSAKNHARIKQVAQKVGIAVGSTADLPSASMDRIEDTIEQNVYGIQQAYTDNIAAGISPEPYDEAIYQDTALIRNISTIAAVAIEFQSQISLEARKDVILSKEIINLPSDIIVTRNLQAFFNLPKTLGRGGFKTVNAALDVFNKTEVAHSQLHTIDANHMDSIRREIEFLDLFHDEEGIIPTYHIYHINGKGGESYGILQPRCDSSFSKIRYNNLIDNDSRQQYLHALQNLMNALETLSQKNVLHRDIKPDNMMLLQEEDLLTGKLIDFGAACYADSYESLAKLQGTPGFIAPEIIATEHEVAQATREGREPLLEDLSKSDVWGMGMSLYYIFSGENPPLFSSRTMPIQHLSLTHLLSKSDSQEYQEYIVAYPEPQNKRTIEHLIWRCLRPEVELRPSPSELAQEFKQIIADMEATGNYQVQINPRHSY
ncbi:MAG: protein kinase domain-containing protein [Chlamydiota bacterium]